MAKMKRKCRGCGEPYEPQYSKDNVCLECRYFLRALHSKNIFFFERLRAEYIKRYGEYLSYGQFEAKLERIERRRKGDNKRKKGNS